MLNLVASHYVVWWRTNGPHWFPCDQEMQSVVPQQECIYLATKFSVETKVSELVMRDSGTCGR